MPSTYSNLKIQLMATGENTTTWGDVTNTNLGTAIEEAIVGSADVAFSNANVTITLTNTNGPQNARNVRLNLTGTATAGYNLIVPAIEKPYIINNGTDGTITVKNTTGTGIAVPAGKTMWVYNNGTNVVDVTTHLTSLTLASALPVLSGGTGSNTASGARTNLGLGTISTQNSNAVTITGGSITGITDLAVADGGTGASDAATARTNLGLGTISTQNSNAVTITGGSITGITDLAVADGGTGASNAADARTNLGVPATDGTGASGTWGINVTGNAGTVTNGVYTTGNQTIGGTKTFSSTILLADGGFMFASDGAQDTGISWASDGVMNVRSNNVTVGQFNNLGFTGNAANVYGTVAIANGGTGGTTQGAAQTALDVPSRGGSGASGTWGINISGNAATATSATTATTAGSVTNAVTFNNSGSGAASGTTFNGSAAQTISYNTLGATTVGGNMFTLANPSAVTFPRFNADNTVSALDAASFRTAIGAGTVTSVDGTGSVNGLSLSGTVSSTGSITLSGSVTSVATTATIDGVTIGYRSIPRSTTSGTAVVGDVGKCIAVTAGITIPNSTFAAGDAISIYNDSGSAITITAGVTTLRQAGTGNTGNRTLAARGMATVWFNSATEAVISGAGVN